MYSPAKVLLLGLMAATLTGCGTRSPDGGVPSSNEGFSIIKPLVPVLLKQGDKQTINITLSRDANFKQEVKLEATPPKGLKVETPKAPLIGALVVKPSEPGEVSLSISADKDIPLGDYLIKVTGTPEKGTATSVDIKVTISQGAH